MNSSYVYFTILLFVIPLFCSTFVWLKHDRLFLAYFWKLCIVCSFKYVTICEQNIILAI